MDGSGRGGGGGFSITHSFGRINHDELSMKKTSLSPPLDDISVTNIAFAAFGYSKLGSTTENESFLCVAVDWIC